MGLFKLFKKTKKINQIAIKNNDIIIVNGKRHLVGEHFDEKGFTLHCID